MEGIKELYELSKDVYKLVKNDNGESRLIEILLSIVVLIAPSTIYIFLFKREIFNNLSEFKLILLCILLNLIIFLVFYKIAIEQKEAQLYKKMILCDYDLLKYEMEVKTFVNEVELFGKEVEKVNVLVEMTKADIEFRDKIKYVTSDLKKLKRRYEKGDISEPEYKSKAHKLYLDANIDMYKENYINNNLINDKILEGSKAIEKIEKIEENGDLDKKAIMLKEKEEYLKAKYEYIKVELQEKKYRIFKLVSSNMIIVSLIPLIMYGLVIIYNYILETKYNISQVQILYFTLVSIIALIPILNTFIIKLELIIIKLKIKKFNYMN